MLEIADVLHRWWALGRDFAVATVVAVHGSAPRQPGAALAVADDGEAVGSVSGGCVEAAVYELCQQALASGRSTVERFGYSDEDAFAVGLTCGGVLDVLVAPVLSSGPRAADSAPPPPLAEALAAAADGQPAALARVVAGPPALIGRALLTRPHGPATGSLGGHPALDRTAAAEAAALLDVGRTTTVTIGTTGSRCGEPITLLVESSVPAPRMLIFGAVDFASALVRVGKFLGYHVTVCDARPVFATARRFPEADEVVAEWPHRYLQAQSHPEEPGLGVGREPGLGLDVGPEPGVGLGPEGEPEPAAKGRAAGIDARTVVCVLTHDPKFDVPLLERALRLPVGYVGAMGSRRTHLDRLRRLRAAGLTDHELSRLHSPIGLDLGARTPEETALSIAAEIVATRHGGTGTPLTGANRPIHGGMPGVGGAAR